MTTEEQIEKLGPWFHNIYLPDGNQTAPNHFLGDFPSFKWDQIKDSIPKDLTNWNVLDVGCNSGFYSIELASRGAQVTAIDLDLHYLKQAEWVAREYGLNHLITFKQMQVYDLAHTQDTYDIIWFMGVFYHLRYPLYAMDILSQKTTNMLVLQTLLIPVENEIETPQNITINERQIFKSPGWPSLSFVENKLAGDPTNWWVANSTCIKAMLRSCGFTLIAKPEDETFIAVKDKNITANINSWNQSEYLSAIGMPWKEEVIKKTSNK